MLQDFSVEASLAKGKPVGWAAPTYKQLLEDWRNLANLLQPVITRRNEQEKQLALIGGGVIDFWSLENADAIRGRKYGRFVVNEAAIVPNLTDIWNLVIRPTLIDYSGDAYIGGTPKGRNGFWNLYNQRGEDWANWSMSSYANPHIPRKELDGLRDTMSERAYRQEILAEFVEDGGGVFRGVRTRAVSTPLAHGIEGREYVVGVDWGRTNDATVFVVLDIASREMVHIERMTDTDYRLQISRLVALAERFNNPYIVAELNSMGGPQVEAAQTMGLRVDGLTTSNATKAAWVDALALAFERATISILPDETLITELESFESSRLPSGLVRYAAPAGMHDDCVMALALAYTAVQDDQPLVLFGG